MLSLIVLDKILNIKVTIDKKKHTNGPKTNNSESSIFIVAKVIFALDGNIINWITNDRFFSKPERILERAQNNV